jgi:multicomponent Na+:H+ antiporter subunit E
VRIVGRVALLVALWLLAWGDLTVANAASGVLVAGALLVAFPPGRRAGTGLRFSVGGFLRLAGYLHVQLLISNFVMTRQILRRRPDVRPGVIAHRLAQPSEEIVTMMTSIIALSPGTMTVEVEPDSSVIYVHFFALRDVDKARASLAHLEDLAMHAISGARLPDRRKSTS